MINNKEIKTLNDIIRYSILFLKNEYGIDLDSRIVINNNMECGYGYVKICDTYNKVKEIGFNKQLIDYGHQDVIIDTIKHEMIHYALYELGKPYNDCDEYFKNELIKHNCNRKNENGMIGIKFKYNCNCGKSFIVSKKSIYKCSCSSVLQNSVQVVSNGIEIKELILN